MLDQEFSPGPDQDAAYRAALGSFCTGVTVVTAVSIDGPIAMTANSFASVSLHPAIVLWCPAKSSKRHDLFIRADRFVIHVLAEDQQDLATHFARTGHDFSGIDWDVDDYGVPTLNGCLARFACQLRAVHESGDHSIILGDVRTVFYRSGNGLIFERGRYGRMAQI